MRLFECQREELRICGRKPQRYWKKIRNSNETCFGQLYKTANLSQFVRCSLDWSPQGVINLTFQIQT